MERLDSDVAANDRVETICNRMMSRVNEFFEGVQEFYKMRIELMERLDRLQNEQTKQRTEMEALIELMRDTSPAALLLRIRQQEDEIRELKGDRP